jgi:DNA-binding transcriptional MerR regulator
MLDAGIGSMTLAEIAESSGLPAPTIRFYIARGLLSGPVKSGRGAAYTADHLAHLDRIKALQSQGRTLSEIAHILSGPSKGSAGSPPAAWWQYGIADDVTVQVRADASPWRMKQVRAALDEFARRLRATGNEKGKDEETT